MATDIYIDEPLPENLTRVLYLINQQSQNREEMGSEEELEAMLTDMDKEDLVDIDSISAFERHSDLYCIGIISGGGFKYPDHYETVEEAMEQRKPIRNLLLAVPQWYLDNLESTVKLSSSVGSTIQYDTVKDLREDLPNYTKVTELDTIQLKE